LPRRSLIYKFGFLFSIAYGVNASRYCLDDENIFLGEFSVNFSVNRFRAACRAALPVESKGIFRTARLFLFLAFSQRCTHPPKKLYVSMCAR
jgi:hypothetical protein